MPSPRRSLALRLLLANLTLILAALLGLVLWMGLRLQSVRIQEARVELGLKAVLIANALREPVVIHEGERDDEHDEDQPSASGAQQRDLQTLAASYAQEVGGRVTVFSTDLRPLASSDLDALLTEYAPPEAISALRGGETITIRQDELTGQQRLFVAAIIAGFERPAGVVQLSIPMSSLQADIRSIWLLLLTAGLVVALLSVLASVLIARQIIRPIQALTTAANQLAAGDLSTRLDLERQDELGELAAAFDHMAAEIGNLLARERAFVANASHELRSPLTAIQLRAELLQRLLPQDERSQRYLAEIERETGYLSRLTAQLLDLTRLDAGAALRAEPQDEAPAQSCSPLLVLSQVSDLMDFVAQEKHIHLHRQLPPDLPDVSISAEQLEMVVRNVLDNAIKYTPSGGRVWFGAAENAGGVHIEVRDTGIGIPAADLPHVFDRFYRVDKARDRQGAGLGLSLVQAIMARCHGVVAIESREGEGTTVTLTFPVVLA